MLDSAVTLGHRIVGSGFPTGSLQTSLHTTSCAYGVQLLRMPHTSRIIVANVLGDKVPE